MRLIITSQQSSVAMGRSVQVEATLITERGQHTQDYILLPFVNQRRWGAHERSDNNGKATFILPLPNPGPAHIQILAYKMDTDHWMGLNDKSLLMCGYPMPKTGTDHSIAGSNILELGVTWRDIKPHTPSDTLFCMQWEPWFTGGIPSWETTQAVPLTGLYSSYNRDVLRQQMLWFADIGVDFIMPDWSNHLWGKQHWHERSKHVNTLLHATEIALEALADMRDEGIPVPKVALMPGLSNGRPTTMEALNEQFDWIYRNYLRNPRFDELWQYYEGKPLIIVLDTGAIAHSQGTAESAFRIPFFKDTLALSTTELDAFRKAQIPVDDSHFTVRWMSSQNQTTMHHELGYWSWMDGVIAPPVTYIQGSDGIRIAESVTVTPSFFNARGWKGPKARGRRGGTVYLETFKVALAHRPRVIHLHQWQEYTGQREGNGRGAERNIYTDTYSVELSDDLEPVSLTAPGYRGDTGGWGFYYLNLTQALMDLYRRTQLEPADSTILAIGNPLIGQQVETRALDVTWSAVGAPVDQYTLSLDGHTVLEHITGNSAHVSLDGLNKGLHKLTLIAEGAKTRYPLSRICFDESLTTLIPAQAEVPFLIV